MRNDTIEFQYAQQHCPSLKGMHSKLLISAGLYENDLRLRSKQEIKKSKEWLRGKIKSVIEAIDKSLKSYEYTKNPCGGCPQDIIGFSRGEMPSGEIPSHREVKPIEKQETERYKLLDSLSEVRTKAEELIKLDANTDLTNPRSDESVAVALTKDSYKTLSGKLNKEKSNTRPDKYQKRIKLLIKQLLRGQKLLERCIRRKTLSGSKDELDKNSKAIMRNTKNIIIDWK